MEQSKFNWRQAVFDLCIENLSNESQALWFREKLANASQKQSFFITFGLIGRKIPRDPIQVSQLRSKELSADGVTLDPTDWLLDQVCRLCLLLSLDPGGNHQQIKTLVESSDMREQVVIYKSLPFLSNARSFELLAIDGIRTNMTDVFDSIALRNVYPAKYFNEESWNQMVLKAIFMERPIYQIEHLDARKNSKLAAILYNFVHERWSAGRSVSPELWRLMTGYLNEEIFQDLKKVVETGSDLARDAALKALGESDFEMARNWLNRQKLQPPATTWETIGKLCRNKQ